MKRYAILAIALASAANADILLDQGSIPDGSSWNVGTNGNWTLYQPFIVDPEGWHLTTISADGHVTDGSGQMYADVMFDPDDEYLARTIITFTNGSGFVSQWESGTVDVDLAPNATYYIRFSIVTPMELNGVYTGTRGLDGFRRNIDQGWQFDSPPIGLRLEGTIGGGRCRADCDFNGTLNTLDFLCFLNAYNQGDADYNGDGVTNTLDFLAYLNDFAAGC